MAHPRNAGRALALVVLAAIGVALSLTGSGIDATGWAPNVSFDMHENFTSDRSRKWSRLSRTAKADDRGRAVELNAGISCIARDRKEKSTLYLCSRYGILKSTDHGKSYRVVLRPPRRVASGEEPDATRPAGR